MSIPKRITINCPKCGEPISATVFESVNTNYANDIAEQIISGTLFEVECPHCKSVSHLEYDILYNDMHHDAMVWVIHPDSPNYEKNMAEVRSAQKLLCKPLYVVDDMNALKERVSYLEHKRDGKSIEEQIKRKQEERLLAEQQWQADVEREQIAQIQKERNAAILKRMVAIEVAKKKKKKTKAVIIMAVIAIIAVFTVSDLINRAHNGELRNFVTEEMSNSYTNVYADVVSIEPEYVVYIAYGSTYSQIGEVVCRCKTVENRIIWLVISSWRYPGGNTFAEDSFEPIYYSKSQPMRLIGEVTTAKEVTDELVNSIGNVFVLRVHEIPGE